METLMLLIFTLGLFSIGDFLLEYTFGQSILHKVWKWLDKI